MKDQQRKKQRVVERNQDYISILPNPILCNILSYLKIKEAVKTSVLSSKWMSIYTDPTKLILDADNILARDYSSTNFCHLSVVLRFQIKSSRAYTFVSNVNQYLSSVENVIKLNELKVCFTFRHKGYGSTDLDNWIQFAVKRNVENIDLCLLEENQFSAPNDGSLYVFPCHVIGNGDARGFKSVLKCLHLAHCVVAPYKTYNYGFSTLITLELLKVDLKSQEHIHILLSSCNNLERLSFSDCYNMGYLKIQSPFCQKLKYLNVNHCRQLKSIVLRSTSLESLGYFGRKINFNFDAPRLKTFISCLSESTDCYGEIWPVVRLSNDLPQLETLFIECGCYMGSAMSNNFPSFPNLRHLEVIKVAIFRQDLTWLASALKACPKLGKLELHLRTNLHIEESRKRSLPPKIPHNHLKEVSLTGIRGHSSEIDIAIFLLKNAIALEKMTVDPRPRIYLGNGKWSHSQACEDWSSVGKPKVQNHLKQVNSLAELLILEPK